MTILSIANQKGGVGKSTTAFALASGLGRKGHSILCIDLDPQGNLTHTMRGNPDHPGVYESVIEERVPIAETVQHTAEGDLIGASTALAVADTRLTLPGREYKLKLAIDELRDAGGFHYDFVVIDTPPALGILTVNALTASRYLIIPAQADIYSLQGIGQLFATVDAVTKHCNHYLRILGIVLTRHNPRSILSRDMTDMIRETAAGLGTSLFETAIRETVAIKEAQAKQTSIYDYDGASNAAADCLRFTEEFLRKIAT